MYLVVPPRIEKQFLFLSPLVTSRELPSILGVLCEFGVSVLDIQCINYEKLQYEGEGMSSKLNKHLCLFKVRGSTLLIPVGFVIKVSREALVQSYIGKMEKRIARSVDNLDTTYGGAFYLSTSDKEYKVVR